MKTGTMTVLGHHAWHILGTLWYLSSSCLLFCHIASIPPPLPSWRCPQMTLGALALSCCVLLQWDGEFRSLSPIEEAKGGWCWLGPLYQRTGSIHPWLLSLPSARGSIDYGHLYPDQTPPGADLCHGSHFLSLSVALVWPLFNSLSSQHPSSKSPVTEAVQSQFLFLSTKKLQHGSTINTWMNEKVWSSFHKWKSEVQRRLATHPWPHTLHISPILWHKLFTFSGLCQDAFHNWSGLSVNWQYFSVFSGL